MLNYIPEMSMATLTLPRLLFQITMVVRRSNDNFSNNCGVSGAVAVDFSGRQGFGCYS